ncbi:MAG TPA: type IV secretion system protein [Ktedonobacterales bacterium]|nr:type IV secretion system protein [Ktedonobacterales bacterium]
MATASNTPIYQDELVAWHNQRLWWLLCGSGAVIIALVVALGVVTMRPHAAPYVIAVNSQGQPIGTIQSFIDQEPIRDSMLRYAIDEYIREAFLSTHEFAENKMNLSHVYAMSTGQANDALTAYYRANHDVNNPLINFAKFWQDARVTRTLKLSAANTYQVDYILDRHDSDHPEDGVQTNWRATLRIVQGKPTDNNELGIWVTDLDFSPEAK